LFLKVKLLSEASPSTIKNAYTLLGSRLPDILRSSYNSGYSCNFFSNNCYLSSGDVESFDSFNTSCTTSLNLDIKGKLGITLLPYLIHGNTAQNPPLFSTATFCKELELIKLSPNVID
jgi:hypothetical protein